MSVTVVQTMCQNDENEEIYHLARHFGTNYLGV